MSRCLLRIICEWKIYGQRETQGISNWMFSWSKSWLLECFHRKLIVKIMIEHLNIFPVIFISLDGQSITDLIQPSLRRHAFSWGEFFSHYYSDLFVSTISYSAFLMHVSRPQNNILKVRIFFYIFCRSSRLFL